MAQILLLSTSLNVLGLSGGYTSQLAFRSEIVRPLLSFLLDAEHVVESLMVSPQVRLVGLQSFEIPLIIQAPMLFCNGTVLGVSSCCVFLVVGDLRQLSAENLLRSRHCHQKTHVSLPLLADESNQVKLLVKL